MTGIELGQILKTGLQLNQTLLQSLEILQMDQLELEEFVKEQIENNPILEQTADEEILRRLSDYAQQYYWVNCERYYTGQTEWGDPFYKASVESETESLNFFLLDQLERRALSAQQQYLCKYLIYSMDAKGMLQEEDITSLTDTMGVPKSQVMEALRIVQSLEPAGVGARNIRECMVLQLQRMVLPNDVAVVIVEHHLEDAARGHVRKIAKDIGCKCSDVEEAIELISTLNLNPANEFDSNEYISYIYPDAFIVPANNRLEIVFNTYFQPSVKISPYYLELYRDTQDKETKTYLREKIRSANVLTNELFERKSTIERIIRYIVEKQEAFFLSEGTEALVPLRQIDAAEELEYHESTISRAIRGKYIQTKFGTYPLKFFFVKQVGEGDSSSHAAKKAIKQLIDEEDKTNPHSDARLAELLAEKNIQISRRTVAKYRMELDIPGKADRKQGK